jgi:2-dehydro-3-deoxyphosphogluconate aldolase / (4S)-4-hydroxy-2-oxoglutarate aldolase
MPDKKTALKEILDQGLLPLFFHPSPEQSLEVIRTLSRAGVRTLEYTNRGPEALENFRFLKKELAKTIPDFQLGIGTIKTEKEVTDFILAGADYIVCPIVNPRVGDITHEAGMLWVPGCLTPTEVYTAQQADAALIKIFPANTVGGPGYITAIRDLFPGQLFIPTGGVEINETNIKEWFRSGVCAVGMGSKLISKEILQNRSYDILFEQTVNALEIVRACKPKN